VLLRIGIACFVALSLGRCVSESSMKKLDPYIFLHDNSSKVWLVDKLLINKNDYTPMQFRYKQLIVFHQSRNAYFYRLHEFGDRQGLKAYYWMDKSRNEFAFELGSKKWIFDIRHLSRDKIVLKPKYDSYPYTIVLIPFPEY
jgi:hypothetical protein